MTDPDAEILSVARREGTYFYRDDQIKAEFPVVSQLTVATILGEHGSQTLWRSYGLLANMAEGIAQYYVSNPGMKEAVDGMFTLILSNKLRR
jgi:hypothetical protein